MKRLSLVCILSALATAALWAVPAVPNGSRLADAVQNQDRVLVQSLLKQHGDANGTQPDRTTALIWATNHGNVETVTLLLAAGADAKAANRYGRGAESSQSAALSAPVRAE